MRAGAGLKPALRIWDYVPSEEVIPSHTAHPEPVEEAARAKSQLESLFQDLQHLLDGGDGDGVAAAAAIG